ncbi:hypothetical protein [Pseudoroseomonas cervicalis]|uniref:hypothetical protein n=1 Tax=Teichococcus cervicalis TaxID=204525 RepID=UPI0022F19D36|nr:hypothetical protein [Pseudoroseomonas cervicalis]WBV45533.1 hypothetical protein PFY06_21210 [Pseudoroseomonas cervicalis]
MRVVLIPCLLGAVLLPAAALAQPARQGVPPLDTSQLHARSFDVRGFDPLGLPAPPPALAQAEAPAAVRAPAPVAARSASAAPLREARAEQAGSPMFSDGWSRNAYGALR